MKNQFFVPAGKVKAVSQRLDHVEIVIDGKVGGASGEFTVSFTATNPEVLPPKVGEEIFFAWGMR